MEEITLEYFEQHFDQVMDRVESGESFVIVLPDGERVVAIPVSEYAELTGQTLPSTLSAPKPRKYRQHPKGKRYGFL